jgi:hypothetical protein
MLISINVISQSKFLSQEKNHCEFTSSFCVSALLNDSCTRLLVKSVAVSSLITDQVHFVNNNLRYVVHVKESKSQFKKEQDL